MKSKNLRLRGLKRMFTKDKDGVSEILGDILLVSVAVIVIGSIAIQVVQIDKPQAGVITDLEAVLDGNDLIITHMGGKGLESSETDILVGIAGQTSRSFKISDGLPGSKTTWKIGEKWTMDIGAEVAIATTGQMRLYVQVIDNVDQNIILDQVLLGGIEDQSYPDPGFEVGSMIFSKSIPDGGEAIEISVTVINYGIVPVSNIEVRFFDDKAFIGANTSISNLPAKGQPNDNVTVILNWTTTYLGRHIISAKIIPKSNETNLANNYLSGKLSVGFGVNLDFTKPNLVVKSFKISKNNPKSKETVVLEAVIANTAKITSTGFTLRWGELFEGTNSTMNNTVYVGNVTYVKDVVLRYEWTPAKGGYHIIWINIENVLPSGEDPKADADPELDGDYAELEVDVLPKILFVDDDLSSKGTNRDVGVHMREALKAIGISPDVITVGAGDGPQFTGTGVTLDDYDLVIWSTGYETTNTLTTGGPTADIKNLKDYLDAGGSVWMIGQEITNDLWNNGGAAGQAFLQNYLHVSSQTLDVSMTSTVRGNDQCNVAAGQTFDTYVKPGLSATPDLIQPDLTSISVIDNATNGNFSLLNNQSGYKVAFFSFDFSHIKGHSDRSVLAYKILAWFNATVFFEGDDLSVSEVSISPQNPYYKQEVTITAMIRNNGINDLNNVKVIFKDVFQGIEIVIPTDPLDTAGGIPAPDNPMALNISAFGGINVTVKHWIPDRIGLHQIKVVVDPNDVILEIDENNNEFVSELSPTDVYVDSITLIVDDDQTVSGPENTTSSVVGLLDFLNYRYELYNVSNSASDGPALDNLTKYNTVIWVLGNESTDGTTITTTDSTNLESYLTGYQGNLWIIGQNMLEDATVRNNLTFRRDLLGINGYTRDVVTPSTLIGVTDHNITHGMRYPTTATFGDEADAITPGTGVEAIFLNATGSNFGIAFHNTAGVNYKVMVTTFEPSFIDDVEDQRELAFMTYLWFTQSDQRIELRVTWDDIQFGRDNGPPLPFATVKPVLGASYLIQAKVWNAGLTPAGAVVRFLDGTTVINSASVYVPGASTLPSGDLQIGSEIAEVIWTPLFAGDRPLTVKIDPDMNIPVSQDPRSTTSEALKKNNNVTRNIEVFFFYDDMENTAKNWTHETTLVNVNGEQPIEYFDTLRPIDTNVVRDWDNMSGDWKQLFDEGHTLPSSYHVAEPFDTNITPIRLRVGICIEDSAQIKNSDPNIVRLKAAWNFTNDTFQNGDELTIYRIEGSLTNIYENEHPGNGTFEVYPFENMTKYLNNTGQAYFDNSGGQRLIECIDDGTTDLQNSWTEPGVYPALVVITSAKQFIGSTIADMMDYSRQRGIPIYMVGVGDARERMMYDIAMVSNGGLYFYASTGEKINDALKVIGEIIGSGGSRSMDGDGTAASSRDGTIASRTSAPGPRWFKLYNPVGTEKWAQGINRNVTYWCSDARYGNDCKSPKIYFDPGTGVFTEISTVSVSQSPFDWTADTASFRGADECWEYNWSVPAVECLRCRLKVEIRGGAIGATSGFFEIFDSGLPLGKHAFNVSNITSKEFNLADFETARLSYWHKYDMLTAENGGLIMVGNSSTNNSGYKYHYVIPTRSYPGNMRLDKTVKDDDGKAMSYVYNGKSAGQTGKWTYDEVDLTPFISSSTPWIRVRFSTYYWGYGNGGGWWLDDVKVKASRAETSPITDSVADQWEYYEWDSLTDPVDLQPHSGKYMWWNHNPTDAHDMKSGIDNSLMTKSIDLSNAKDARMSAYFMFNVDDDAGRPPDGFRTEVSADNGVTWKPINLGVRASWGTSGDWNTDGKSPDGTKAYTGIQDSGLDTNTPTWVRAGSLWRMNTDLTGWSGSVIKIRFRVVTNLDGTHYERATTFRGIAVDDVIVQGNTTLSGAPVSPPDSEPATTDPWKNDYSVEPSGVYSGITDVRMKGNQATVASEATPTRRK